MSRGTETGDGCRRGSREARTLAEALDEAARGGEGIRFFDARGKSTGELSYAELRERARQLARRLPVLVPERGDRVGILAETGPEFLIAFHACQLSGRVAVPLPAVSNLGGRVGYEKRLRSILEESEIRAVFAPEARLESLSGLGDAAACGIALSSVHALAEAPPARGGAVDPLGPGEISHIQFSSGSTRFPRGIRISQRAVMANARSIGRDALALGPGDSALSWLPFYHDMGLIGCVIVPMVCGIPIDYLHTDDFARNPAQWLRLMSARGHSLSFAPSFGYEICARLFEKRPVRDLDLSKWRVAGVGGDMVEPGALRRFAKTFEDAGFRPGAFMPGYGLAEATLAVTFERPDHGFETDPVDKTLLTTLGRALPPDGAKGGAVRHFVSSGYPMPGYAVEILDDSGVRLPERRVGQVWVRGPALMDGYHDERRADPLASEPGKKDRMLDTGDMGYLAEGKLFVTGRRKDMILINGRNIWPQDLEWFVEREVESVRIRDTAAFAALTEDDREEAVLLVQCRSRDTEALAALRKSVRACVRRNAGIDCRVELVPPRSLPFTTSGKLMRSRAKADWLEGKYEAVSAPAAG